MSVSTGRGVFLFERAIGIESFASVVGNKEGEGPLGKYFDKVVDDSHFGMKTWEQAESRFQLESVSLAVRKPGLTKEGKPAKGKIELDETVQQEARKRVNALLNAHVLYPELDLDFLKKEFVK